MTLRSLLCIPLFLSMSVLAQAQDMEVDRYCAALYVFSRVILDGRDGGIDQASMREEIMAVEGVTEHPRLRRDVEDVLHLAYVVAPDQPSDELAELVVKEWCMGES